jgi:hypothetical protein
MTIKCFNCNAILPDYKTLAQHIIKNHRNDKKGLRWASNFLMKKIIFKESKPVNIKLSKQDEYELKITRERMMKGDFKGNA